MQPLIRPATPQSAHSWWSGNPLVSGGPTMSIHAAAKPLMRFMYGRDVRRFIKRNRGTPLSRETMEIYASYLAFKHVPDSAKVSILQALHDGMHRAHEVQIATETLVEWNLLVVLLRSPCWDIRLSSTSLVHQLLICRGIPPLRNYLNTSLVTILKHLASLLRNRDFNVRQGAGAELLSIARTLSENVRTLALREIFEDVSQLLDSADSESLRFACDLVCIFAGMEAVVVFGPFASRIAKLLSDVDKDVRDSAVSALLAIGQWPVGALHMRQRSTLICMLKFLYAGTAEVHSGMQARLESAVTRVEIWDLAVRLVPKATVRPFNLQPRLCSLLLLVLLSISIGPGRRPIASDTSAESTLWELIRLANYSGPWLLGLYVGTLPNSKAQCLYGGDVIKLRGLCRCIAPGLRFQPFNNFWLPPWSWTLLVPPCCTAHWLATKSNRNIKVRRISMYALSRMTQWPAGPCAVEWDMLFDVYKLLDSPDVTVQKNACKTLGNVAADSDPNVGAMILSLEPFASSCLAKLLIHPHAGVRCSALYALAKICAWREGVDAVRRCAQMCYDASARRVGRSRSRIRCVCAAGVSRAVAARVCSTSKDRLRRRSSAHF
ncbi:armadillo-type protein [Mycena filopes]|nr:armadillo-type protein [Mycena filopes]